MSYLRVNAKAKAMAGRDSRHYDCFAQALLSALRLCF